jgi:hypothetical protein
VVICDRGGRVYHTYHPDAGVKDFIHVYRTVSSHEYPPHNVVDVSIIRYLKVTRGVPGKYNGCRLSLSLATPIFLVDYVHLES